MAERSRPARLALAAGLVAATALVALLNSGGYRYGVSDQAFYQPAVTQHLDPSLFPRDRELLRAQSRFMLFDVLAAATVRATHVPLPTLFAGLFLAGLGVQFAGSRALGRIWFRSEWAVAAFMLLLTLRHRITRTGVNTLEGYLHPRLLAFGVGVWALVAFLRGRPAAAVALVALSAVLHTTTALWFAIWLGIAIAVAEPRWRRPLAAAAAVGAAAGVWLMGLGPLREQLVRMDARWLSVLAVKDYLMATEWPLSAWLVNLAYPAVVAAGYRLRASRGLAQPREGALVIGCLALAGVFLASLPFVAARVALAVQLQVTRVFWMLDLMTALYLVWMAVELGRPPARRRWVAIALAVAAVSRGVYIMRVEQPGRPVMQVNAPEDAWTDAMAWLRRTPADSHVLADPNHVFLYGSSARVFGERDLLLEASKDTALAIYSPAVAARVAERIEAVGDFAALTPGRARDLARRYDLDYLVSERPMALPVVYANGRFTIYALGAVQ